MAGIKIKKISIEEYHKQKVSLDIIPRKQHKPLKLLAIVLSEINLILNGFKFNKKDSDMEYLKRPCLILMNHIYETDFKIAFHILRHTNFSIVAARDAFIGRKETVRKLGCIPVLRFNTNCNFVKYTIDSVKKFKNSILMYPEAEYSMDGLGQCVAPQFGNFIKTLGLPVLLIRSYGNFHYRPVFTIMKNKSKLSADIKCILTEEDVKYLSPNELRERVNNIFISNNYYKERKDLDLRINNKNRAFDYNKIFFKCPHCLKEGEIVSKDGNHIICKNCKNEYVLNEDHSLKNINGETKFDHVESWIRWQKEEVKKELINKSLSINMKCKMYCFKNYDALYDVNKIVDVNYSLDTLTIKYDDVIIKKDLSKQWGISMIPRNVKSRDSIITEYGDDHFQLCPLIENGLAYKLRISVVESFNLKHNK